MAEMDQQTIDETLIESSKEVETPLAVVRWWERYRLMFNILVGVTGIVSLYFWGMLNFLSGGEFIIGVLLYGMAANICFSLGWGIELLGQHYLGRRFTMQAVRSFFLVGGMAGSVVLTFLLSRFMAFIMFWGF